MLRGAAEAGEGKAADPAAFQKGFAAVEDCLKRGQPAKGLKALSKLLEAHREQPYARAKRAEIESVARLLTFRRDVKQPDPKTLVSGKLKKWTPATGDLKIAYKRKSAADLQKSKRSKLLYFPFDTAGPFKLTVTGKGYPRRTDDSPWMIFGGDTCPKSGEEVSYSIMFGVPPYTEGGNEVWLPASITRHDGDNKSKVAEKEITPAKAGKSYKLLLNVQRSSLSATINGKPIGKAKKPKAVYGSLAFEAQGWSEVTFSGKIEPSWLQERIDKAVQKERAAFDKTYDAKKVLPAWLFEGPKTPAATETAPDDELPDELDPKFAPDLLRVLMAVAEGRFSKAIKRLEDMKRRGASASVCTFMIATVHEASGDTQAALKAAEASTQQAPGFILGWMMKGRLLRRLGRHKEAAEAFRDGIGRNQGDVRGYEMAMLSMLRAGDLEAARAFGEEAAKKGLSSKRLSRLGGVLVKARKGPTFSRVYEYKSRNYHVVSDIGKKVCVDASKVLETAYTSYRVNFGWVRRDKTRLFKVYLFGGRTGFMNYQRDLAGLMGKPSERAAGIYSPLLKQLLIWNLPTREEMIRTIRHEGFHQYLDRLMPDPPVWFNEGLAVYHEYAKTERGRLAFGHALPDYLQELEDSGLLPMETFLFQQGKQFYEDGHRSYAQAWALVHMLKHGPEARRAQFEELVKAFQTDAPPREVLLRVFPKDEWPALQKELEAYVEKLRTS
ncbi:MAG: DUF1570 domain-containing protein [Planctomycetota bacterium]|nr:DUF1570 domain-containing protein [Planctomycetota bacterium]